MGEEIKAEGRDGAISVNLFFLISRQSFAVVVEREGVSTVHAQFHEEHLLLKAAAQDPFVEL